MTFKVTMTTHQTQCQDYCKLRIITVQSMVLMRRTRLGLAWEGVCRTWVEVTTVLMVTNNQYLQSSLSSSPSNCLNSAVSID